MRKISFDEMPMAIRIEDLMGLLSIGRNAAYALIHSGKLKCIKIGKSYRIPKLALMEYILGEMDSKE